jgi:hypothetical protein
MHEARMHARTHIHTHARTLTCTRMHVHMHAHTDTYVVIHTRSQNTNLFSVEDPAICSSLHQLQLLRWGFHNVWPVIQRIDCHGRNRWTGTLILLLNDQHPEGSLPGLSRDKLMFGSSQGWAKWGACPRLSRSPRTIALSASPTQQARTTTLLPVSNPYRGVIKLSPDDHVIISTSSSTLPRLLFLNLHLNTKHHEHW